MKSIHSSSLALSVNVPIGYFKKSKRSRPKNQQVAEKNFQAPPFTDSENIQSLCPS